MSTGVRKGHFLAGGMSARLLGAVVFRIWLPGGQQWPETWNGQDRWELLSKHPLLQGSGDT